MKSERIEEIYNKLSTLVVDLDRDPVSRGPAYLQDLISKTRGYLNITMNFVHEVHREKSSLETELDAKEAAYAISHDGLLADDHRVTRLPNIEDRKAMINLLLREERAVIVKLKNQVKELGFVDKAIRHRHKELESTMSAIRMQKGLVDSELRTGSFYGDENETSRKAQWKASSGTPVNTVDSFGIDEEELTQLLSTPTEAAAGADEDEGDSVPPQAIVVQPSEQPKSVDPVESEDVLAVEKFLEGDDYSDVFKDL